MSENPRSVRLTDEAAAALDFLKARVGGFNLQKAINQTIIAEAKKVGWPGQSQT